MIHRTKHLLSLALSVLKAALGACTAAGRRTGRWLIRARGGALGVVSRLTAAFMSIIGVCLVGVAIMVPAAAYANAPNPSPNTTANVTVYTTATQLPDGETAPAGAVTINLSGSWDWATVGGPQTCAGRYGEGVAVDWWEGKSNATLLDASQAIPTGSNTENLAYGPVSPNYSYNFNGHQVTPPFGLSANGSGSVVYNGWNSNTTTSEPQANWNFANVGGTVGCTSQTSPNGKEGSIGPWSATATYPSTSDVPAQLCVIFYDMHGNPPSNNQAGSAGGSSDLAPNTDGDNSIQTNAFDPRAGSGFCFSSNFNPNISLLKSGPATGNPNGTGTYKLVVTNAGNAPATNSVVTDTLPSGESFATPLPTGCVSGGTPVGGATPGTSATMTTMTCTIPGPIGFTAPNNTAEIDVTVDYAANDAGTSQTDCATVNGLPNPSCVTTNFPELSVAKSGPADGVVGQQGAVYTMKVTNSGTADAMGGTVTDTLAAGETFAGSNGANCAVSTTATAVPGTTPSAGDTIVCTILPTVTIPHGGTPYSFTVLVNYANNVEGQTLTDCAIMPGQSSASCVPTHFPQLVVVKSGPATGTVGGNGIYNLVVTNNGSGASADNTPVTDTLPVGETFLSSDPNICTAVNGGPALKGTGPGVSETVTCKIPSLAASGSGAADSTSIAVTVAWDPGTDGMTLTDCASVDSQSTPSCVPTKIPQQQLQGFIYLCLNNVASTNVVNGGNLSATGPQPVNPTGSSTLQVAPIAVGTYTMSATAPANYNFVECGSTANIGTPTSATEQVLVPANGVGTGIFYVTPTSSPKSSITLTVNKTNNADGQGFAQTETATGPGENVPFQVVVTNTTSVPVTITDITDSWPGQSAFSPSCASQLDGTTLQPNQSATCDFTQKNYAPAAGDSLTNTVNVTGCQASDSTNCVTVPATSTVNTPAAVVPPSTLAFTGPPAKLQLLLELGFALLSAGMFVLWYTRPRRLVTD